MLRRAAELGVAVEHNAAPERLDLSDRDLRLAKEIGCKIVINTDAHDTRDVGKWKYGIRQLRRAWLTPPTSSTPCHRRNSWLPCVNASRSESSRPS